MRAGRFVCGFWLLLVLLLGQGAWSFPSTSSRELRLYLDEVRGRGWQVRGVEVKLLWEAEDQVGFKLSVSHLRLPPPLDSFKGMEVECPRALVRRDGFECFRGVLRLKTPLLGPAPVKASFRYRHPLRRLDFSFKGIALARGRLDLKGWWGPEDWKLGIKAHALELAQLLSSLAYFWPGAAPDPRAFVASGKLWLQGFLWGKGGRLLKAELGGSLKETRFTDQEGLWAGEHLVAAFALKTQKQVRGWEVQADLALKRGELYIDPVYLEVEEDPIRVGFKALWRPQGGMLQVSSFCWHHPGILAAQGRVSLDLQKGARVLLASLKVESSPFSLLYPVYLQPFLAGSALGSLAGRGDVSLDLHYEPGKKSFLEILLKSVDLEDQRGRYGIRGLEGRWFWTNARPVPSRLSWKEGHVYRLALGAGELLLQAYGSEIRLLQKAAFPVLDGTLQIHSFTLKNPGSPEVEWEFEGLLTPVSMEALSRALDWPILSGKVSGVIPRVTYARGRVRVEGVLEVQIFGGTVRVRNLRLEQPFGLVPKLYADMDLDLLDLETLTERFAFGRIQGKLSGKVHGLYLEDWQAVSFDARFYTPQGDRSPHRISQKAVDNLVASLGGMRGVLSRSFLRFFEEFSYDRLSLSCRLRNGICEMGGLEAAQNGYYIVKGKGLPRVNIVGYTRRVRWESLLERLREVAR